jgi:hypothetical protein
MSTGDAMSQPEQQQEPPGTEQRMDPGPDHGEQSYREPGRLAGRAAVITGGDSGIGKAVAIAFAREGAGILISCLDERTDRRHRGQPHTVNGSSCHDQRSDQCEGS